MLNNVRKKFSQLSEKSQEKRKAKASSVMVMVCRTCQIRNTTLFKSGDWYYCQTHIKAARIVEEKLIAARAEFGKEAPQ